MVKQSLEKQPTLERDTTSKPRLHWSSIPAASYTNSGKSPGNPVVEVATPNGTNNQPRERIKTDCGSEGGRTLSRLDEQQNPFNSGRTDRNWSEVFRIHKWSQSMIGHREN